MRDDYKKLLDQWEDKRVVCPKCKTRYEVVREGVYRCPECGFVEMTSFGKIKTYLTDNGPTSSHTLSEKTGVPIATINKYLRQGRIEIPENSPSFIKCEKCGRTEIRYGRFCPECALSITKQLSVALSEVEVGEVAKRSRSGKMHYLQKDES